MSKKRRDRGTGTFRQRANGTWEGRYGYTDDLTGKRITKSVYAPTKTLAISKLKVLIERIDNRSFYLYIEANKITISNWLDTWMK